MSEATSRRLVFDSEMPKIISVRNHNRTIREPLQIKYCDTFLTQLRGFTFRSSLPRGEGLLLVGSRDSRIDSSIHMLFVPFDLAVIWINSAMQVVDKIRAKSWRPAYFSKQPARYVLEIHPDRWGDFEIGDGVEFKDA
jgi:uncharacterized membrane protein (UPF0127 family)